MTIFEGIIAVCSIMATVGTVWNTAKIKEVHLSMNSRLDQLLESSNAQAFAEGGQQERLRNESRLAASVPAEVERPITK